MRILGHPAVLLFLSASAGMVAQEFVSAKLWAANDQTEVVSVKSLTSWGTTKAYYANGRLPRGLFPRPETMIAMTDPVVDVEPANASHSDPIPVAARIPEDILETPPTVIAQRETEVVAQPPTPPPASTTKPTNEMSSEPDADTVHILPPPAKRVPDERAVVDEPGRAIYDRTPPDVVPPSNRPIVTPPLTGVAPSVPERYPDAKELIRRRAAKKAEERRRRIEIRKWLGYSPLRPSVNPMPLMGGDPPTVILVPFVVDDNE